MTIPELRRDVAFQLRELAQMIDITGDPSASDNQLASTLSHNTAEIVESLVLLYGRVEAQRAVAFAADFGEGEVEGPVMVCGICLLQWPNRFGEEAELDAHECGETRFADESH